MGTDKISGMKLARGMSRVVKEFRNNPHKVFFDTLNTTIDHHYVYGIDKKEIIKYLEGKVKELESKQ